MPFESIVSARMKSVKNSKNFLRHRVPAKPPLNDGDISDEIGPDADALDILALDIDARDVDINPSDDYKYYALPFGQKPLLFASSSRADNREDIK